MLYELELPKLGFPNGASVNLSGEECKKKVGIIRIIWLSLVQRTRRVRMEFLITFVVKRQEGLSAGQPWRSLNFWDQRLLFNF